MAKKITRPSSYELAVKFLGLSTDEKPPQIALYLMGERGKAIKKVSTLRKENLTIPKEVQKPGLTLAIGPDVEKPEDIPTTSLQQYRSETIISEWRRTEILEIPEIRWRPLLPIRTCVSGTAEKCWFELGPIPPIIRNPFPDLGEINRLSPLRKQLFSPYFQVKCKPLCYGKVEVYRRVCCCDPWLIIPEIPELIPELIPIPWPDPDPRPGPFPDPFPGPFPGPIPGPDPAPINPRGLSRNIVRRIKTEEANLEPANWQPISDRVANDLKVLYRLQDQQAQYEYLLDRPYLVPVLCRHRTCTTVKIGETNLGPDGSFNYCFPLFLTLRNCTVTYTYKIKQWIGGQWIYVYDGVAAQAWFSANEMAELKTFDPRAEICSTPEPPVEGQGKPFVMLQAIGTTDSYKLHSPIQQSANGINQVLGSNGGLIDQAYANDCPLGGNLDLLLYVDPDMKGTGARYYRFSLVAANGQGNPQPGAEKQILNQGVTWRKFIAGTFPPQIEGEALGPKTVGGTEGLFEIPYVDANHRWLGNQFHYRLDTTDFTNGRYLLILELFNAAGDQIKPVGAGGSGTAADFHFIWWDTATTTQNVPYSTLIHALRFDNVKCYGDIIDLRKNGIANTQDCQFMSGPANTQFSVGFRAYHQNDYMLRYELDYFRGLNGSDVVLETGVNNRPATKGLGQPAQSASANFGTMLGNNTVGTKCTFSLDLKVYAKHTNGRSRLSGYDSFDEASFALEIV